MAWFIDDLNQTQILITDGVREYYITKTSIDREALTRTDGDVVNVVWLDFGTGGRERLLPINYLDVVDGYSGYINNPSSATDLANQINAMIVSGWTDIGGGGDILVNKGDLLSHNGVSDEILTVGDDTWILQANSAEPTGLEWVSLSTLPFITTVPDASTTVKGISKLSVAPVSPTNPIAVGDNDTRMTNARTPTAHASTHTNGTDDIQSATAAQKGLLTAADWSVFSKKSYVIGYSGVVASTNTASEEALANITIPGGTLAAGDLIDIRAVGRKTSGTGSDTFRVRIDASTGTGGTLLSQSNGTSQQSYVQGPMVLVTGAATQIAFPAFVSATYATSGVDTLAPTLNTANNIFINVTNQKVTSGDGFELRAVVVIIHKKS